MEDYLKQLLDGKVEWFFVHKLYINKSFTYKLLPILISKIQFLQFVSRKNSNYYTQTHCNNILSTKNVYKHHEIFRKIPMRSNSRFLTIVIVCACASAILPNSRTRTRKRFHARERACAKFERGRENKSKSNVYCRTRERGKERGRKSKSTVTRTKATHVYGQVAIKALGSAHTQFFLQFIAIGNGSRNLVAT